MEWLQTVYGSLNETLFNSTLPAVTFRSNLVRKCIAEFVPKNAVEIGCGVIAASDRDILDELVHVMVHVHNHARGISDHSSNQYHNQHFRFSALAAGLYVCHHQTRGYALTFSSKKHAAKYALSEKPTKEASEQLNVALKPILGQKDDFASLRDQASELAANRATKVYVLKYVCKCSPPHNSIRSGRRPDGDHPLNITCNVCGAKFVFTTQ